MKKISLFGILVVVILSCGCNKENNPLQETTTVVAPKLSEPADSSIDVVTDPILSWFPVDEAEGYALQVSTDPLFASMLFNQNVSVAHQLTGLSYFKQYFWRVRTVAKSGYSVWSQTRNFTTTLGSIPQVPTLIYPLLSDSGVSTTPQFKWSRVPGAAYYSIQISTDNSFGIIKDSATVFRDTNYSPRILDTSSQYWWRVVARNRYGTGNWPSAQTFKTLGRVPNIPVITAPRDGDTATQTSISFVWNDVSGAKNYHLQVSTDTSFSTLVFNSQSITSSPVTVSGLYSKTQYYARVSAFNDIGASGWSGTIRFKVKDVCHWMPEILYEGQTYHTVAIGSQCWLNENLNVGTQIIGYSIPGNNPVIEKYCYQDNVQYCALYGGLYQWSEAMGYTTTGGARGICPEGWHIPTKNEYITLTKAVNNKSNALKAVGQGTGSGAGTNTSGFSALLAGYRGATSSGGFTGRTYFAYFWSGTESSSTDAEFFYLDRNDFLMYISSSPKTTGFSVRCIKN